MQILLAWRMLLLLSVSLSLLFFFIDTPTTEIYTLSLHDALPISELEVRLMPRPVSVTAPEKRTVAPVWLVTSTDRRSSFPGPDRKSTRLNSSHANISYAVFCLKKKIKTSQALTAR